MLEVYQRPDYWVRPWQMVMWHTRHIIALMQDCSRGLHSYVSARYLETLMLHSNKDPFGSIDNLCANLHRIISVGSFLSLIKFVFGAPSKPFLPPPDVNFSWPDFSSPCCCAASLGWEKGLVHYHRIPVKPASTTTGKLCLFKFWNLGRSATFQRGTPKR